MTDQQGVYAITSYGATGEGDDTDGVQAAIDAAHEEGGGTVRVPAGTYTTGTIELRSNVTLSLSAGATIQGSTDGDDYGAGWTENLPQRALVVARDAENIAITGRGTLHGRAREFMHMDEVIDPRDDPAVETTYHEARQGDDWLAPENNAGDGPVRPHGDRPQRMFLFYDCENVVMEDVTVRDSPHWTVHLLGCEEVDVRGVDMLNEILVPNSDGINPELSRNVHISDCTVYTGDDAICPKASDGYPIDGDTENLTVTNCTLVSRSCAIKFGSSTANDIRNCVFENIVIRESNRGLGIQHRDGGDVENVLFSNITIETDLHTGNWWGKAEPIYVTSIPRRDGHDLGTVRNVRFSNVTATSESGALLWGHEASSIEDVTFDGVDVEVLPSEKADLVGGNVDLRPTGVRTPVFERDLPGVLVRGVRDFSAHDLSIEWHDDVPEYHTAGIEAEEFADVTIDGVVGRQAGEDGAVIALRDGETATVRDCRAAGGTDTFLHVSGVEDHRLLVDNDFADAAEAVDGEWTGVRAANLDPR